MSDMRNRLEWLEADGLGGFASGTASGIRTRRYHALLLAARRPPGERFVLVNGLDAAVTTAAGTFALSSQHYAPDAIHPDGVARLESFEADPWPRTTYRLPDGGAVIQEIFVPRGMPLVAISWRLVAGLAAQLEVRLFLSGRDYHALHHENPDFRFAGERRGATIRWRPYDGVPSIVALNNGSFEEQPLWYRNFEYEEERARGLDSREDLASPGLFKFELTARREAVLILAAEFGGGDAGDGSGDRAAADPEDLLHRLRRAERARRQRFPSRLHRAAEDYIVKRGEGTTIIAGYPWFLDWGRDTFIALRGLCLATGRLAEARDILLEWAGMVSEGMLPNRFPDSGDRPELNSVDASLWYIVAVHDYLRVAETAGRAIGASERRALHGALESILDGYARGTRYGIRLDDDGLLLAGEPGVQLTWMDAKVGDWVVTPRIGKPVEVQALWLNALWIGSLLSRKRDGILERGRASFAARFWNERDGFLHDVIDPDGRRGEADPSFRPNQIFAVGGLPLPLITGERARRLVDAVEERLYTPLGLRSLAPGEPGYAPRYEGGVRERDGVYHQGTVWPWLLGPFVEAWVRSRGDAPAIRREARDWFLAPLLAHLDDAGLGHISEIADAEPPHTPRGCPFQAWSVGEALRLSEVVLDEKRPRF
jgi:predicted glycogen debranching enzyme